MTHQNLEKLGVLSADDYVNIVREVWQNIHPRRTVIDYALHVLDHASKLGEAIRRDDADLTLKETAETANWLFAFVAKLNDGNKGWEEVLNITTKFSRMIWDKYPGLCPHCFQRIYILKHGKIAGKDIANDIGPRCKYCLPDYPRVEVRSTMNKNREELKQLSKKALRDYASDTASNIPQTLRSIESMFHRIYRSNVAISTIESIGFHVLEEAGEMGRSVIDTYTNKYPDIPLIEKKFALSNEIAEGFGWLCSLTLKVRNGASTFDRMYRKYRNRLISFALPSKSKENARAKPR